MTSPWWGPSPMGGPINTPSSVGTGTRSYSPTTAKPIGTTGSGGSSEPSKPSKPSKPNGAKPPAAGSADAADRRSPGYAGPTTIEATSTGQTLWDVLDMPDLYGEGTQEYVQTIDGKQAINYTVAAGVEWLRHEAVTNPEGYNSIIARLYQAGYLSEGDVKFNTFSGKAAQAFADAAFDVARINMDKDPGAVITLDDHLQGIIDGFTESGFGPGGPGGAGAKPEPPTRVDQWSNPDDLRETLHTAAEAALGRRLSDDEESKFLGVFKSKEAAWNSDRYQAEVDQFNGKSTDVVDRPNAGAAAQQYMRNDPKMAQEKAGEDMASYVGIMNRMMGLGEMGVGLASG